MNAVLLHLNALVRSVAVALRILLRGFALGPLGLAVSLIFGIFVSTVLTLVVIPVGYFAYLQRRS